jgi:protein gp37
MAMTPQHTYLVLTKRHGRMRSLLTDKCGCGAGHMPGIHFRSKMSWEASMANPDAVPGLSEKVIYHEAGWPLQNVVLGVSVEDQHWANIRIPALLETPAASRFISAEPLLGPINLRRLEVRNTIIDALGGDVSSAKDGVVYTGTPSVLDQIVVGGESGPGAKPMDPEWARSIVEQCRTAWAVPFVKQLGSHWAKANGAAHSKGGDPEEWPAELRVRQYPKTAVSP